MPNARVGLLGTPGISGSRQGHGCRFLAAVGSSQIHLANTGETEGSVVSCRSCGTHVSSRRSRSARRVGLESRRTGPPWPGRWERGLALGQPARPQPPGVAVTVWWQPGLSRPVRQTPAASARRPCHGVLPHGRLCSAVAPQGWARFDPDVDRGRWTWGLLGVGDITAAHRNRPLSDDAGCARRTILRLSGGTAAGGAPSVSPDMGVRYRSKCLETGAPQARTFK